MATRPNDPGVGELHAGLDDDPADDLAAGTWLPEIGRIQQSSLNIQLPEACRDDR
jgi:hypothetical protein